MTPIADSDGMTNQSILVTSEPRIGGMSVAGTAHDPIAIDGDANFSETALLEGWEGDGSPENPYMIDGLDIDLGSGVGHCISISNTRVNFNISKCYLTGATGGFEAGIYLYNVKNAMLTDNTCNSNSFGIHVDSSDSNTVSDNTCSDNVYHGIYISVSDSNTVANNTCTGNNYGICLEASASNTMANNTCTSNSYGIYLYLSDYNTVTKNTCADNGYGIYLYLSDHNTVMKNTCTDHGIYLSESNSNIVTDNTCNNNRIGIYLYDSDHNTVDKNTCNNNRIGIYLYSSDYNTVVYNTCLGNTEYGICLFNSDQNTVAKNITDEFVIVVLLLVGLVGITLLGAGWRMASRKGDKDDIIVPLRYRLISWLHERRPINHEDADESLEPDSLDE